MLQQINLYQPIDSAREEPFSAMMMLVILVLTLVLMMMFYGVTYVKKSSLEAEIKALKRQNEQNMMIVEKLEATVNKLTDSKKEQQKLNHLKKVYVSKQNALSELSSMVQGNSSGVSNYFSALARKDVEPIWFHGIDVYSGGQQVLLQGQTTDARSIPRFISSLKEEAAFNGVSFRLFKAQRKNADTILDFSLQTELNQDQ